MFFDTPPHDPAPRHNKGLSYRASYEFCHAKLLHHKLTKRSYLIIGTLPIQVCRFVMHQLCTTNFKAGPALGISLCSSALIDGGSEKIEVRE
jgi:hypothetical protein